MRAYTPKVMAVLALIGLFSATSVQAARSADAYPKDDVIFGSTYGEWAGAWWQWASAQPVPGHPLFDTPTSDCSNGQSGPVWFLGGSFCPGQGGPVDCIKTSERNCTVPKGKALFFPIMNWGCLNIEAKIGMCPSQTGAAYTTIMRAGLAAGLDGVSSLTVTVDGKPVQGDLKKFRFQAPVYWVSVPDNNLFQALGEDVPAGEYWGVDDGYYLMLQPLPPGPHTLYFKGVNGGSIQEFTYHLTISN